MDWAQIGAVTSAVAAVISVIVTVIVGWPTLTNLAPDRRKFNKLEAYERDILKAMLETESGLLIPLRGEIAPMVSHEVSLKYNRYPRSAGVGFAPKHSAKDSVD